jgi:N-acylneuraminate cytidylyltransferase
LDWLKQHEKYEPDIIVHLRPTSPVRRVEDIDAAVELLMAHPEADAVRSVGIARQTPYKMWQVTSEGYMEPLLRIEGMTDCQSVGRQILPVVYLQNGVIDILRPRAIWEKNSMWGDCVLPLIIEKEGFDVDYPEDIPAVEAVLKSLDAARSDGKPK